MSHGDGKNLTTLLEAASRGDADAAASVADAVHADLRRIASAIRRSSRSGETLRTTALVNEAYLRLLGGRTVEWSGTAHFLGVASKAMRSILVDHARARMALKRGGNRTRVPLDEVLDSIESDRMDILALDEALTRLERIAPRKCRVVELRYFGGQSIDRVAEVLDVSHGTVESDWRFARSWLLRELSDDGPEDSVQ